MSLRPGISDTTLERLGIRRVTAKEAQVLTGAREAGIYIPFTGVNCVGGPYGRLRLDYPKGDKKYHQRWKSKVHNYVQEGLALHNKDLILIEGEFKAISLTEAGFPAVGVSGLHSWGKKIKPIDELPLEDRDETDILTDTEKDKKLGVRVLHREIQQLITKLNPARVVFVGDPDTTLNLMFGGAMCDFANLLPCPLAIIRIPFDAPHGKGVDDIREALGQDAFAAWFQQAINEATLIIKDSVKEAVISFLIDREREAFPCLTGAKRENALDQLSKLHLAIEKKTHNEAKALAATVKALVRDVFKTPEEEFTQMMAIVGNRQEKKRETEQKRRAEQKLRERAAKAASKGTSTTSPGTEKAPDDLTRLLLDVGGGAPGSSTDANSMTSAPFDASVFDPSETLKSFVMVGEEYYTYSYVRVGSSYRRSNVMSVCSRTFVDQALKAAGFSRKTPSTRSLPIVGEIPNLSQQQAAMFYLSATRCSGKTNLLFRPYGPLVQPDGTKLFNTSLVRVMEPKDEITATDDPRIAAIMGWLAMFFGGDGEAFEHFLSLLSYVYEAARAGAPKKTRAVFFLGPPNSGKSLLIDKIIPMIFGQSSAADAHRLIKGEAGTTTILGSYVCKLSDKDLGNVNEIRRVQQGVLSLLADHTIGGRALFQDVQTIDVINLFMFSSNPDGSVVKMLDGMPPSIIEKFAIYEGGFSMEDVKVVQSIARERPMSGRDLITEIIESLPYFCSFLVNWDGSRFHEDRFGVCSYVPEKFTKQSTLGPKEELIKELLLQHSDFRSDSGTMIYRALCKKDENKALLESIESTRMVSILSRLAQVEPDLVQRTDYDKTKLFSVTTAAYKFKYGLGGDELGAQATAEVAANSPAPSPPSAS